MDRFELRRQDLSLDENQQQVQEVFAGFFAKQCPTSVVRAAEPHGFDAALWRKVLDMGVAAMSLPEAVGGDDATLVDLVLVAEEHGRRLAPIPLASHVVATRLLAALGAPAETIEPAMQGTRIVSVALQPTRPGVPQLVPDAAVATDVLALIGDTLVLHSSSAPAKQVPNQGCTPLAWWQADTATTTVELASGPEAVRAHTGAVAEWKLLTAAALVGMTEEALRLGVEFAKSRMTMGVPIGSLQGVAFPLADVAIAIDGARNLVRKAAWFAHYDPTARPELPLMAFDYARRTAGVGTTTAAHMQGGLGFTTEADASLYFLRAKGWSAVAGSSGHDLAAIGAHLIGATAPATS